MATDRQQALADLDALYADALASPATGPATTTRFDRLRAFIESVPDPAETEHIDREDMARVDARQALAALRLATRHGAAPTPSSWRARNVVKAFIEACDPAETERLRRATRTRPDYDLRCQDCGAAHNVDTSIPSAVWNRIAEPASVLCTLCIDERLTKAGLTCDEAEFYYNGDALRSKLYAESHGEVARLERELAEARAALLGTRERYRPEGIPCWCPEWALDEGADWHHECCIRARASLSASEQPGSNDGD
jgi:hypothetical protein